MNIKDLENLAELARIKLSEEEKAGMLKDIIGVLDYVKIIEGVKAEGAEADYALRNVWREDKLEPREFSKELIIGQFPDARDGFLKVKKIL